MFQKQNIIPGVHFVWNPRVLFGLLRCATELDIPGYSGTPSTLRGYYLYMATLATIIILFRS